MKQETVSGSGISWAICKSAPRSRQITTPTPHHSVCYRPDAQPTVSKHWRSQVVKVIWHKAASSLPHTDSSIVFVRWRQCAPPSNTQFLGPVPVCPPNGISTGWALSAMLTCLATTQTDKQPHHNFQDWLPGIPGLFTDTSENIRLYFLVFLFSTF